MMKYKKNLMVSRILRGMTGYNTFLRINIPRLKEGRPVATSVSGKVSAAPMPDYAPVFRTDACGEFMASVHDMTRRVSRDYVRAPETDEGGNFYKLSPCVLSG